MSSKVTSNVNVKDTKVVKLEYELTLKDSIVKVIDAFKL